MSEFNIDQYKQAWQEQPVPQNYSSSEILQMLNHKSRNYMKYILYISTAEFIFFLALTLYYLLSETDVNNYLRILEKLGIEKNAEVLMNFDSIYLGMKIASLLITAIFVLLFLLNYQKIKVESNLKKFILQIIKFKRTVNLFIFTNIALLITFTAVLTFFIYATLNEQNIALPQSTSTGLIVGLLVTTALSITLIWLYYRVVYGIILKRLGVHLKQLQEIEEGK